MSNDTPQVPEDQEGLAWAVIKEAELRVEERGEEHSTIIYFDGRGGIFGGLWGTKTGGVVSAINYFLKRYWPRRGRKRILSLSSKARIRAICEEKKKS